MALGKICTANDQQLGNLVTGVILCDLHFVVSEQRCIVAIYGSAVGDVLSWLINEKVFAFQCW